MIAPGADAPDADAKLTTVGFAEPLVLATTEIDRQSFRTDTFIPKRLKIPSIDVNAVIQPVGKDRLDRMDTPTETDEVGWYRYGAKAGATGNVVLSGHLDDLSGPAIFANLGDLRLGESVTLQRGKKAIAYEVVSVERYRLEDVPLASIFAATQAERLQLITCAGPYDPEYGYRDRIVVTAIAKS
ncbi:class F sortase [Exiguobacterium sp. IPCH1]|nr:MULTISPECIES: class F sortase [unclassified Exiguobacterium]TCI67752.1 class F sortase [Exiguobacterium sp. IPCI3]TCI77259.1 class F sortase [Exiguobacterium sp. IPCH1]TCI78818.1 class F sortase [Exiguobacterium sp. IPBC4]